MSKDISSATNHRNSIRFLLNGEMIELTDVDPTRTVLQYLREDLKLTGTKEGCAEGDCGACTVVLAEIDATGNKLQKRAVNSCIQFLPTLDGKELITVESLGADAGDLHPIQEAMVQCHGSQCGFCTPGFVMSLYALFENDSSPTRRDIDDALAGNLCRCTGYKPIVDAALQIQQGNPGDKGTSADGQSIRDLQALQSKTTLAVVSDGKKFFAPQERDELASLCQEYPSATLLAGGTDVGLWVTKQRRELDVVIYTGNVRELRATTTSTSHLEIGAGVTLTDAMQTVVAHYPALEELFVRFASPPIRNAGTLGGNIANGSPIGDSMPALLVLGASLQLGTASGSRTITLEDFYLGYQETALLAGEFVEKILIPLPVDNERVASYKVSKRFDQDISALCGAYRLLLDGDKVADIKIAYGGMAAIPQRASACEAALQGDAWTESRVSEACQLLATDFTPISDMRSSARYRTTVGQNLLRRFFLESSGRDDLGVYQYGR